MIRLHGRSIFPVLIALLHLPSQATAVGPPTVLTFDDVITVGIPEVPMPAGYGGLSWPNNIGVWGYPSGTYLPQSPPNRVAFNLHGEEGVAETLVTFIGGPKIFDGAYFSGFYNIQFNLYRGATLVGTSGILSFGDPTPIGTYGPTFLASGYSGPVDSVGIVGNRAWFAMDNFTFEEVPEPSTLILLGLGAISLLGRRTAKPRG